MAKTKLKKFAELDTLTNVIQPDCQNISENYHLRGHWSRAFFRNSNPLVLEIGCGKGEYTVSQALECPDKNFIGIDIKGERLWRGAKTSLENDIRNTAFIRVQAQKLEYFFGKDEVSEIWITFPDPQLQKPKIKKRLTSERLLSVYKNILTPEGVVHLKTDNEIFFDYTEELIKASGYNILSICRDIYNNKHKVEPIVTKIMTYYEEKYVNQNIPINYLKFSFK
ncbi:MAG: tRNA (guanosine(46)-N7)-methyltransferase TrmB [Bacteroidetes bacterium]|nr:tRNA (guanosine(46)-N7)-methyltransferase TrmB [Bacteroidota bacterium]